MSTQYLLDKKRGKGGKERDGEEESGGGVEDRGGGTGRPVSISTSTDRETLVLFRTNN